MKKIPGPNKDEKLKRALNTAREMYHNLICELVDEDPCRYDHHGYCQAHNLHEKPCPHERAKEFLDSLDMKGELLNECDINK